MTKSKVRGRKNAATMPVKRAKATLILVTSIVVVGIAAWLFYSHAKGSTAQLMASTASSSFQATIPNRAPAPERAPAGMVWISGGEFSMGASDPPDMDEVGTKATQDARPIHRVYVDGVFIDKTDVTNAEFEKFVKATGYVTVAERKPRAGDFPGAPHAHQSRTYHSFMSSAGTTKVMGGQVGYALPGTSFYRITDNVCGHASVLSPSHFRNSSEYSSLADSRMREPCIQQLLGPRRHRYGS